MEEKKFEEVYVNYVMNIDELYEKGFSTSISKLKNEEVEEITVRLNHLQLPKKYIEFSNETNNYIVSFDKKLPLIKKLKEKSIFLDRIDVYIKLSVNINSLQN
ncbi:hypothetical protein ACTQXV_01190 [Ligilactobacillus salivarius]|uniref:hypothetical protein n=1 Tax=Ligilactobacillus salivarius TaxID=1624 RepID=UPI003992A0B3